MYHTLQLFTAPERLGGDNLGPEVGGVVSADEDRVLTRALLGCREEGVGICQEGVGLGRSGFELVNKCNHHLAPNGVKELNNWELALFKKPPVDFLTNIGGHQAS